MNTNLQFFLNTYSDLCPTAAPSRSQFKWLREINGVPYTFENSQQIQVLPGITTSNLLPYNFSTPANSGTYAINSTTLLVASGAPAGIAPDELIVGANIPVGTYVISVAPTQYAFSVVSANATVGAIYGNNGQTFTVTSTIISGSTLNAVSSGSAQVSGVLTLISGVGDATISYSAFTASTNVTMSQAATATASETISFYNPASFLYLESDQQVSMIYNGGSPMALLPFEINGVTVPGVFFMNGPCYSLTISNSSALTANVFLACMG